MEFLPPAWGCHSYTVLCIAEFGLDRRGTVLALTSHRYETESLEPPGVLELKNPRDRAARGHRPLASADRGEQHHRCATRSFLQGVDEVRHGLAARAAAAEARARAADSERDRVAAAMETYELQAAFDEVLVGTWREVTALMQERGLR
jgi:hypothetical protein